MTYKVLPGPFLIVVLMLPCFLTWHVFAAKFGDAELMYEWTSVELDWPSEAAKTESIRNGSFLPERNLITGIKIYKDDVYVTIPRWTWNSGRPATLLKVVTVDGVPKLRPYPSWQMQQLGNCKAFQFVQSMEIDRNTGFMYVIDTGRTGFMGTVKPNNLCPPKLVVIDLNNSSIIDVYEFPDSVVSRTNNFMNDIVLDYVDNRVRFAYITDVIEGKLYSLDLQTRQSYSVQDKSMKPEKGNGTVINIHDIDYTFQAGIDGIAMSCDLKYVYVSALSGYKLYQIQTSRLRNLAKSPLKAEDIRLVGRKVSQSDGMVCDNNRLYFGALALNAVYFWDIDADKKDQKVTEGQVQMRTQTQLVRNDTTMQWADTFALDGHGWLWFVSNTLQLFNNGTMDFSGAHGPNMRLWRVFVSEASNQDSTTIQPKTTPNSAPGNIRIRRATSSNTFALLLPLFFVFFLWLSMMI